MKPRTGGEKIADPVAHADRKGTGPYRLLLDRDQWGDYAPHYTTLTHFGRVDGVRWYNNCGPTALTNLLVMARRRYPSRDSRVSDRALYAWIARYGTRRLFYINREKGPARGTSDLRAGTWLRRMFRQLLGMTPRVRFRRATRDALLDSLDRGALLYLLLRRHPAYRDHHLVGFGYTVVESETTGERRTYLKVSDGHAAGVRYLDLTDYEGKLRFYYEITFPARDK